MQSIRQFVLAFFDDAVLVDRTVHVLSALPDDIRGAFLGDPCFHMLLLEPRMSGGSIVFMPAVSGAGLASRCIVLKTSLRDRTAGFAHYVIAHELAHAWLGNRGRWPGDDPETAADALAAEWGFERPDAPTGIVGVGVGGRVRAAT